MMGLRRGFCCDALLFQFDGTLIISSFYKEDSFEEACFERVRGEKGE